MDAYLQHYGIKGQKLGVRRWQNEDGTFNEAGKRKYFGQERYGRVETFIRNRDDAYARRSAEKSGLRAENWAKKRGASDDLARQYSEKVKSNSYNRSRTEYLTSSVNRNPFSKNRWDDWRDAYKSGYGKIGKESKRAEKALKARIRAESKYKSLSPDDRRALGEAAANRYLSSKKYDDAYRRTVATVPFGSRYKARVDAAAEALYDYTIDHTTYKIEKLKLDQQLLKKERSSSR